MNPGKSQFAAPPGQMNDGPFVDEVAKNARRIFYPSLTNSGNLQNIGYSDGYYRYIVGYMESL